MGRETKDFVNKSHIILSLAVFFITLYILTQRVDILEQHGDEKIFTSKAWYFSNKIIELNFSKENLNWDDPGFHPNTFWAMEQPFGSHLIYATTMHTFSLSPAVQAFSYTLGPDFQGPNTDIPKQTLVVLRTVACAFSAFGLALLTLRFGLTGLFTSLMLLAIPHVRDDLSRVWAEGPLLFGIGLCTVTFRTRWFALAAGASAAFKLSGLIFWIPLIVPKKISLVFLKDKFKDFAIALLVFTLMNPVSWMNGGPLYLFVFILFRVSEWLNQSATIPTIGNYFIPTRYLWPLELLVFLLLANWLASKVDFARMNLGWLRIGKLIK